MFRRCVLVGGRQPFEAARQRSTWQRYRANLWAVALSLTVVSWLVILWVPHALTVIMGMAAFWVIYRPVTETDR